MVLHEEVADLVAVQLVDTARHVGDARLDRHIHHDRDVAEAGVHVEQADVRAGHLRQRRRQVRRDRRLADPALRPEDRDDRPASRRLARLAGVAHPLALFLLQDAVNGAAQVLRLQRLDDVVARAGDHRPAHRARVRQRRVHNRRRVRHRVRQRRYRLQRQRDGLLERDEEDVGRVLLRDGHRFDAVAGLADDREVRKLSCPLRLGPAAQVRVYRDDFRVPRHPLRLLRVSR